jgi:hypothetical protein
MTLFTGSINPFASCIKQNGINTMMKQFNPFPDVSCTYGAPMGRRGDNPANLIGVKRLCARFQGGGQGYDKGGAYWGTPSNVWGVWAHTGGETVCCYVRASSRLAAIHMVREGE